MKRPLIYFVVSLFLGSISCIIYFDSFFISILIILIFIMLLSFSLKPYEIIINIAFIIIGFYSFYFYFNVNIPQNEIVSLRVIDKYDYSNICSYKGKKIMVKENIAAKEGEIIKVKGEFKKENIFDKGIIGEYKIHTVYLVKRDVITLIYVRRNDIYERFKENLGEYDGALVCGVCFGYTDNIPKDKMEIFKKLGIIHVISVSGFHMALVYKCMEAILGMKFAIVLSFFYALFTGVKAPTLRAFFMILIMKLSKKLYKKYDKLSALSFAAIILVSLKPYYILDLGFNLSFLSTLGIVIYYNKIEKALYRLPKKINESLSVTLSSQIFSLPYAVFNLHSFSLGFIIGNILLLPLYSMVVLVGNICVLFYKFSFIFNKISLILKLIIDCLNGGNYLLDKILPPLSELTYLETMIYIAIYFCYILVKKHKNKYIYFPLFLIILIFLETYSVFPSLTYIKAKDKYAVLFQYRWEKILICPEKLNKKQEDALKGLIVSPYVKLNNEDFIIHVKDKYIIYPYEPKSINGFTDLAVSSKSKQVYISCKELKHYSKHNNCDIILIESKEKFTYDNPEIIKKLYFIEDYVLKIPF